MSTSSGNRTPLVGVLALQGAFEEHQHCLEAVGCKTRQVRRGMADSVAYGVAQC